TTVRKSLACQDFEAGRLAGTIATHQPNSVTGLHPQRGLLQQNPRAGAQFKLSCGDHGNRHFPSIVDGHWLGVPTSVRNGAHAQPDYRTAQVCQVPEAIGRSAPCSTTTTPNSIPR